MTGIRPSPNVRYMRSPYAVSSQLEMLGSLDGTGRLLAQRAFCIVSSLLVIPINHNGDTYGHLCASMYAASRLWGPLWLGGPSRKVSLKVTLRQSTARLISDDPQSDLIDTTATTVPPRLTIRTGFPASA